MDFQSLLMNKFMYILPFTTVFESTYFSKHTQDQNTKIIL